MSHEIRSPDGRWALRHTSSLDEFGESGSNTWELVDGATDQVVRNYSGSWGSSVHGFGWGSGAHAVHFSHDGSALVIKYREYAHDLMRNEDRSWEERVELINLSAPGG